ncbi:MAG: signal peptidase I [Candidatus Taylorbacteria bacterium]|nr:signal peptidase I [Candidatus Taylorbacteria bacterium]
MTPLAPEKKESYRELIITILIIIAILFPIRYYIVQPFIVNGASMDPTFTTGQYLIVDELSFRFHKPERGQVIILKYPRDPSTYFIKRIVGLPNDNIMIKDGKVTITNAEYPEGFELEENYVQINHISHETYQITLGPTEYFVMGDNRSQSSDSRSWGPLDRELIVGRPLLRLLPLSKIDIFPGTITNDHENNQK